MFLKFLKDFLLKRTLKKTLSNVKNDFSSEKIKTVGVLVDISDFNNSDAIMDTLLQRNFEPRNVHIMLYKDHIRKSDHYSYPAFSMKDISWSGTIENTKIKEFISHDFDLLISYYDIEKAPLLLVTQQAKSGFKVGFATIDKRLNHFMINTVAENYTVFVDELFRYLKILNKI